MTDNVIVLYRIVEHNPPTQEDMRSYQSLGIPLRRDTPEARRRSTGISVFDSIDQARKIGVGPPWYGVGSIAELQIPHDAQVTIERTGRQRGHHTLWGSPDVILGYAVRVMAIDSEEETR